MADEDIRLAAYLAVTSGLMLWFTLLMVIWIVGGSRRVALVGSTWLLFLLGGAVAVVLSEGLLGLAGYAVTYTVLFFGWRAWRRRRRSLRA